jgi:hypothetical protein
MILPVSEARAVFEEQLELNVLSGSTSKIFLCNLLTALPSSAGRVGMQQRSPYRDSAKLSAESGWKKSSRTADRGDKSRSATRKRGSIRACADRSQGGIPQSSDSDARSDSSSTAASTNCTVECRSNQIWTDASCARERTTTRRRRDSAKSLAGAGTKISREPSYGCLISFPNIPSETSATAKETARTSRQRPLHLTAPKTLKDFRHVYHLSPHRKAPSALKDFRQAHHFGTTWAMAAEQRRPPPVGAAVIGVSGDHTTVSPFLQCY